LPPSCVNGGGVDSILTLSRVPVCEQQITFAAASLPALKTWMARPGEILTALDPQGGYWRVRLVEIGDVARGVPLARLEQPAESPLAIEVFQALPEKERFELVLQKLTELGVTRIVPVESQRSMTLAERDAVQAKSHRWPDVILRAAKQCRRAMIPMLHDTTSFADALILAGKAQAKLMLYEGEVEMTLSSVLGSVRPEQVALLVGPEGGFSPDEVAAAAAAGFLPISLGPRILRTETAAIVGTALLQGLLGDLY
jgi:16S rRNA (uracil1498-N3)-methyltransferase